MRIYFDNAATTAVSPSVLAAMLPYFGEVFGNPSSIHAEGRRARTAVEHARKTVAQHLNASIGEVFFTSGGSEGNNMAIKCAVRDLGVRRIVTARTEHHCVLHSVAAAVRDSGIEVIYLAVDAAGHISLAELEQVLGANNVPTLVSLMHGNNEIGTLHPLHDIARLCQAAGAYLHSDTVQTIGKYPFDVQQLPVHFLTASAHKFHGPKGVGFLYINNDVRLNPFIDGGAQERNMRGGTENVAGILGLATAFAESVAAQDVRQAHLQALKTACIAQLAAAFEDIAFNGDYLGASLPHVLSFSLPPSMKADMLVFNLDVAGISASGGSACSSGVENASHVLAATQPDSLRRTVRFSFAHPNTHSEVAQAVAALRQMWA